MKSYIYCCRSIFLMTFITLLHKTVAKIAYKRPCYELTNNCLTKSLQLAIPSFIEGDRELGLETLDPYYMDKLDLKLPGGIVVKFREGYAKGLKNCVVDYARFVEDTLETQMHCNLTIKGKYKSSGSLFMFPIDGEGDSVIKCHNLGIHSVLTLAPKVGGDGQRFLEITKFNVNHSYDGRVGYSMTNLFKGNTEMSNALLNFMNDNWRLVAEEFGNPLVEYGVACVMRNIHKLLEIVPLEQFLPSSLYL